MMLFIYLSSERKFVIFWQPEICFLRNGQMPNQNPKKIISCSVLTFSCQIHRILWQLKLFLSVTQLNLAYAKFNLQIPSSLWQPENHEVERWCISTHKIIFELSFIHLLTHVLSKTTYTNDPIGYNGEPALLSTFMFS